jgi:hypothetical protein
VVRAVGVTLAEDVPAGERPGRDPQAATTSVPDAAATIAASVADESSSPGERAPSRPTKTAAAAAPPSAESPSATAGPAPTRGTSASAPPIATSAPPNATRAPTRKAPRVPPRAPQPTPRPVATPARTSHGRSDSDSSWLSHGAPTPQNSPSASAGASESSRA